MPQSLKTMLRSTELMNQATEQDYFQMDEEKCLHISIQTIHNPVNNLCGWNKSIKNIGTIFL